MRVAFVHYWLVTMRGGEKVLEALLDLFPQADIYTHVYDPEAVSAKIRARTVRTTFIQKLPFAARAYQKYLPLMPRALEELDLRGYDLVISSESGPAKGVVTGANTMHICYCHSPMRYLWDMYQDYLEGAGALTRFGFRLFAHHLRLWDALSARRVDFFAANSHNVARRVAKHYGRSSEVIHPPVDTDFFSPGPGGYPPVGDYYLCVGQLLGYKRVDIAVEACERLGKKLLIIGDGPERGKLQRQAGPNVVFLGKRNGETLRKHMSECRALLFPGEEDFGIVPLEAMACGRPVIAYGKGGALETVVPGKTGILHDEQTAISLCDAIERFEAGMETFVPGDVREHALAFSNETFLRRFRDFYDNCRLAWESDSRVSSPHPLS